MVLSANDKLRCDVTVVIVAFNEAIHISRAIASVRSFAREVLIVDSFSSDGTPNISEAAGARVLQRTFLNYSDQFQWALEHGGITTGWTLRLDADEVIEEDLAAEICRRLSTLSNDIAGVNFDRKHYFMGSWVRHGGRFPLRLLRLWRTGQGRIETRWMDEHIIVSGGRTVTFKGGFADRNEKDLTFFTAKHNSYATREAIDVLSRRHHLLPEDRSLTSASSSKQARSKRWFKENIYNRLPLWGGPLLYFVWRYICQLGFLDGRTGTIYHVLQGFWYRYLVACKIFEFERELSKCSGRDAKVTTLSRLTGYDLTSSAAGN